MSMINVMWMTDLSGMCRQAWNTHQPTYTYMCTHAHTHTNRKVLSSRSGGCFLTVHQPFTIVQLAAAELHCCLDFRHTHTPTHTNTVARREALIQFHFLLELGQMPLSVSCITFTFIIYTHREKAREREREKEQESERACEAHKCKMRAWVELFMWNSSLL